MKLFTPLIVCSSLIATYIKPDYISPYKLTHILPEPDSLICRLNNMRDRWSLDPFKSIEDITPILDSIASKLSYHLPLSKQEIERTFMEEKIKVEKYSIQYLTVNSGLGSIANNMIYHHNIFDQLKQFNNINYKMIGNDKVVILFTKLKDYEKFETLKCDE